MYALKKFHSRGFNRDQALSIGYAKTYSVGADAHEYTSQDFWPLLLSNLKKEGRYLDVGCGVGGWALFLADEGYDVVGVDESGSVARAMSEYNPDLEIKVASSTRVPYADASFDGVVSIGSLDFLEGRVEEGVAELTRLVKPGGFVFVEVPYVNLWRRILYIPLKKVEYVFRRILGYEPWFAYYLFTKSDIEGMLSRHGAVVKEVMPHDLSDKDSHYGIYTDWPFCRGKEPYKLNFIGRIAKWKAELFSKWIASTGIVVLAVKK